MTQTAWYLRRSTAESRNPEATLIASELELELAKETGLDVPQQIVEAFKKVDRMEQVEGALEFRRWKAMQEVQPQLALTYQITRETLVRAAGTSEAFAMPSAGNPPATDDDYRAAINSMMDELRRIYALIQMRNRVFGRIRLVGLLLLVSLFLLLVSTRWLDEAGLDSGIANLTEIAAAGGLGAIISIMRRMQDANASLPLSTDPVQQISGLREGYPGLWMAGVTGPIFALTLFVVFASGIVTVEGLTPVVKDCVPDGNPACEPGYFTVMNRTLQFASVGDGLKMVLWGFVAGFAEKLVPDVLDKISGSLPSGRKAT